MAKYRKKPVVSKENEDSGFGQDILLVCNMCERLSSERRKLHSMILELLGMMQQPIALQRNSAERARVLLESIPDLEVTQNCSLAQRRDDSSDDRVPVKRETAESEQVATSRGRGSHSVSGRQSTGDSDEN